MKVVFYDNRRETYTAIEGVAYVEKVFVSGGKTRLYWHVRLIDGTLKSFACKDYDLSRVEM